MLTLRVELPVHALHATDLSFTEAMRPVGLIAAVGDEDEPTMGLEKLMYVP